MIEKSRDYELGFEHGLSFAKLKLDQELTYLRLDDKQIIVRIDKKEVDNFRICPNGTRRIINSTKGIPDIEIELNQ